MNRSENDFKTTTLLNFFPLGDTWIIVLLDAKNNKRIFQTNYGIRSEGIHEYVNKIFNGPDENCNRFLLELDGCIHDGVWHEKS